MNTRSAIQRRLQICGVIVIAGLLVEGICLRWSRPLAFVVLAGFGGGLIAAGVLYFLYSLLVVEREGRAANSPAGNEK
jgi:hypothetical protein